MSQELYYTSAPKGLKPGSHGYCTVAATSGMAPNVADKLESLSAYRHIFAAGSGHQSANPVVYSYLRLNAGGRTYFVLSRIADAGLDYTQRNNKFAHHVALDAAELPPAGPAWLLAQESFLARVWQGEPRILATGRKPPQGNLSIGICRAWEAVTGDAGWAGVLAESATRATPTFLIIEPTTIILPLMIEAQALLSPKQRWGVTLSTYFTKLPTGVDCQWRCVLKGSPEAKAARTIPGSLIIDLTNKLGPATGGALVEAARSGVLASELPHESALGTRTAMNLKRQPSSAGIPAIESIDYGIEQREIPAAGAIPTRRTGPISRRSWTAHPVVLIAGAVMFLLIGIAVGIGSSFYNSDVAITPQTTRPANPPIPIASPNNSEKVGVATSPPPPLSPPPTASISKPEVEAKTEIASAAPSVPPTLPESTSEPGHVPESQKPSGLPNPLPVVNWVVEEKSVFFPVFNTPPGNAALLDAKSFALPIAGCDLSLELTEIDENWGHLKLVRSDTPNIWDLTYSTATSPAAQIIAIITTDRSGLSYKWKKSKPSKASSLGQLLQDSVLLIASLPAGKKQRIAFREAIEQEPFEMSASVMADERDLEVSSPATRHKLFCEFINCPYPISFEESTGWTNYQVTSLCQFKVREDARHLEVQLWYDKRQTSFDRLHVKRNSLVKISNEFETHIGNLKMQGELPDQALEVERQGKIKDNQTELEKANRDLAALKEAIQQLTWLNAASGQAYKVYFKTGNSTANVATGVIRLMPTAVSE